MSELAVSWYAMLSTINNTIAAPLREMAAGTGLPLVSALILGLIGATSPCQLTTGAGAIAFVARGTGDRRSVMARMLAYLLGKALVYTLLGTVVVIAGRQLIQASIPSLVIVRKVLGPLMILLGLHLLGLVPVRVSLGQRMSGWLEERAGRGATGAFLLGIAFSLAFCPTLFLLFFGLTIPMALASPLGAFYPATFALGATIPLLVIAAALAVGFGSKAGYTSLSRRIGSWVQPAAAAVFILAGLNDTLLYWLL